MAVFTLSNTEPHMDANNSPHARLKIFRESKGWSQSDLAERLGVSQQAVTNWESGSIPRPGARAALSRLGFQWATYDGQQMDKVERLNRFTDCLPDSLQGNVAAEVILAGRPMRISYYSDKVGCALQFGPSLTSPLIYWRLYRLAMLRMAKPRHKLCLLMDTGDQSPSGNLARLEADCKVFEIEVVVGAVEELAGKVVALEAAGKAAFAEESFDDLV